MIQRYLRLHPFLHPFLNPFLHPFLHPFLILPLFALVCPLSACQADPSGASSSHTTVKLVRREAHSDTVPVGSSGTVTATCQPGEHLLSGGYYVYAWEGAASVEASFPSA